MTVDILDELDRFKLPALEQSGVKVRKPEIVLVSRGGFSAGLTRAAEEDARIHLVSTGELATT